MEKTFKSFTVLGILLFSCAISSQETAKHQFELRHDNDLFTFTDRYYTSGLFLSYRTVLTKVLFANSDEQLDLELSQLTYTPREIGDTDSDIFDRPYAGFLGINSRYSIAHNNELFDLSFLFGITGLNSGAGGFQRWYHKFFRFLDPAWVDEINDSFHLNIYASYTKEWCLSSVPFGIRFALKPSVALGSKDVFFSQEAIAYFGKREAIKTSIANHRIGNTTSELFFALRGGIKFVNHNGLIEGNLLFEDNSPLTRPIESKILFLFQLLLLSNANHVSLHFTSASLKWSCRVDGNT